MVELGELDATFRKADIAQLKAFITRDVDIIRRPYARKESTYARRTVFFASVNDEDFLRDPTGNRRFWTIKCENINYEHKVDMQQLWAQVYEIYKSGESWYLNEEEHKALNESNEEFLSVDPIEERIALHYNWSLSEAKIQVTATQVCQEIGIHNPSQADRRSAARVLAKLTGSESKKSNGKRVFLLPAPNSINN
jgi:putative DNA primase/helicase